MDEIVEPTDAEIDAFIDEFDGNLRAGIRAMLHDIASTPNFTMW